MWFITGVTYPAAAAFLIIEWSIVTSRDRPLMKSLSKLSWPNIVMLGMGVFSLWAVLSHPDMEFTYYRSTKPLPNQNFARIVFLVAGIVLMLLAVWGLWIDVHARS